MQQKKFFWFWLVFAWLVTLLVVFCLVRARAPQVQVKVSVYFPDSQKIRTMDLETYLWGVVAAEMPAYFELEALKAQAVAARTYVIKRKEMLPSPKHPQALVCTDPAHCQAWRGSREMREIWGFWGSFSYGRKIKKAVGETKGVVITYQGKLIDPVYHSTCGGKTADAQEVWGFAIPYLKSVPCRGDELSPRFREKKAFSLAELDRCLGTNLEHARPSLGKEESLVSVLEKTASGRVKTIRCGEKILSGQEIRKLLNLNSTQFWVKEEGKTIIFETTGYGHGVGMCQYGANQMAKEGKNYTEILRHYYSGTEIKQIAQGSLL